MKLRAVLEIEVEAEDYVAAADFQQRMDALMAGVRAEYPGAELEVRERRPRSAPVRRAPPQQRLRAPAAPARPILYEEL
jgi:hypothetical protein